MTRKFVLVTATLVEQGDQDTASAGIRKLRRGTQLQDFADEYLLALAPDEIIHRADCLVAIKRSDTSVMTWSFTEYPEDELLRAVSHLSREELLRDLKELLPLKEMLG